LVINALLHREIATRFGDYRLGFFWMLLEPLLSVIVIGVIIGGVLGRTVPEIPYAFFLLNGRLLLKLFVQPMNSGINAVGANQGLLVYPSVKPLDTFIARFVYELITIFFSFTLFCSIGMLLGIELSFADIDTLLECYLVTWIMGCGCGLIFGVASAHVREVEKVARVLQSPLLFVSAVLAPVSALPGDVQKLLLMNPLVHPIELSRKALFPHYHAEGAEMMYPWIVAIILLALGLTLFHSNRNLITQR
jgi:capsular polysaccharide transport system permease protein